MTDYLTLTEFVPGTKAKAQEVNANFTALKNAVNSKAVMNGDSTQLFSVADATADTHAINKSQLTHLSEMLSAEINKVGVKFCVRSGNVTAGKGDLFSNSGLVITPKIGGAYADLVTADYKGVESIISSAVNLSMAGKANGTYNIFATPAGGIYASANTVYKQPARPTLVDGDVWFDTSKVPFSCIKYTNSADVEFLDVPLGKVVVLNSAITSLETFPFNQNGFDFNTATITQNIATNGWMKLPNGLIMQWGYYAGGANNPAITFPLAFPSVLLGVIAMVRETANSFVFASSASVSGFNGYQVAVGGSSTTKPYYWSAIGY